MFQALSRFKEFLLKIKSKFLELWGNFSFKQIGEYAKDEYEILRGKLSDIKGTNWKLAQYHYTAGNISDAIMRFKILQKYHYREHEINYFLGRLYFEKLDYRNSKIYLQKYLNSHDDQYKEESEYCMRIMNDDTDIKKMPDSIVLKKRSKIAQGLENTQIDEEILVIYSLFINLLKPYQSQRILDLGCGVGLLGRIIKAEIPIQYIKGLEFSDDCINIARNIEVNSMPVYDSVEKLMLGNLKSSTNTYSFVLASDIVNYYHDLTMLMINCFVILDDDGMLCIAFKMYDYHRFHFSHEYAHSQKSGIWQLTSLNSDNTANTSNTSVENFSDTNSQTTSSKSQDGMKHENTPNVSSNASEPDMAPAIEQTTSINSTQNEDNVARQDNEVQDDIQNANPEKTLDGKKFLPLTEEFIYSPHYIESLAKQCGFRLHMSIRVNTKTPLAVFNLTKV